MKRGEIITIEIQSYAFGGRGVGKLQTEQGEFVVFVDNTVPGQVVKGKVIKKRKRHAECKLVEVVKRSPDEVEVSWQPISGAPFINLPIEKQQEYKQQSVFDVLRRIGEVREVEEKFDEFIESPVVFNYRNKMEYSFSSIEQDLLTGEELDDAFALGFKSRGTWWKVENLNKPDGLFDEEFETVLPLIRDYLKSTGLTAWHPPRKEGFFRHLIVRKSFANDQLLLHLVTSGQGLKKFDAGAFAVRVKELVGDRLAGLQHTVNDNVADRAKIENGNTKLLYGQPFVIEKVLGLEFEISMESFFQTNPQSAELLYQKAINYAEESESLEGKNLMDLFCGTGTIGQIMASQIANVKVLGVDIVPEAIEDAKRNAARNNIGNIDFFAADVGKFMLEYPQYQGKVDTIILDPPRAGIAPKTLRKVIDLDARQLVYISCNPATQARDIKTLEESGYKLKKFSLVDQFPHTSHIEAVALFAKTYRSES